MEDTAFLGDSQQSSGEVESLVFSQAAITCYQQRNEEFKKLFKDLPESEWLIMDFACALQRDILLQGRLYLSENWLCFHSNVFWGTTLKIPLQDIKAMSREKTAKIIPNAIQINTNVEKLFFSSFSAREKSFQAIFRLWQNTLMDKPLTRADLWHMVRHHYGSEVDLSHEDMDSVQVADSTVHASMSTRTGDEEHAGRIERPSSLRLLQGDTTLGNGTSPIRDEKQSSPLLPSGNSLNMEDSCSLPSRHRTPEALLDRLAPERVSKRSEPALNRNIPERGSKRSEAALERTVPEKASKVSEASLDRNVQERGSKRFDSSVDRAVLEKGSKRSEASFERFVPERSSKRSEASLDRTVTEKGSNRCEPSLDRTITERGSKRHDLSLDRSASDRGSKVPEICLEPANQEGLSKQSDLSLDLNDNEDVSGCSSSEVAAEEELLYPSQAQGRVFVNRVFHISAEKMFELLFTDSPFVQRLMDARKITGCTTTPWQKDGSGSMKRTLSYTITITNPLVGKSSRATEIQILYKDMHDGQHYMLDSEVYTHDVPYHDYFYTHNRYYITHNSKRKCRLRWIYTDVKYKKQPWGLAKSFITKNSWSGLEEYFRHLEAELLEEEAELTQGLGDASKVGGLRRRRRAYSRTLPEHLKPGKLCPGDMAQRQESLAGWISWLAHLLALMFTHCVRETSSFPIAGVLDTKGPKRWNIIAIVTGMIFLLLLLTSMNVGLFFKLWAMEDVAQRLYLSTKYRLQEKAESSLNPDLGSHPLPPHKNKEEVQLLRTVLEDSIELLEQLRSSLVVLQQSFQVHNETGPPQ
ncbi:GRAM domain-containing protein 1C [Arapaima gigas]